MEKARDQEELSDLYDDEDEDTQKDKYLTFVIGKETYGIEILHVDSIIVMQEITEVPDLPDSIIGVINLRGRVISVMDVRKRFHLEAREYDERTCIIVIDVQGTSIGMIVDNVSEVLDIPQNSIDPPPKSHSRIKSTYIQGMGKVNQQVRILLDVEKILYEEELEQIQQM